MDTQILQELDNYVSNLGSDVVWKKQILDKVIWFAPINYDNQIRINLVIANDENPGLQTVFESKRVILSYAIIGFSDHSLFEMRHKNVFEIPNDSREARGKPNQPTATVKVNLQKYLYHKLSTWDIEFFDLVFQVYADLTEAHKKLIRKDIKFEALKTPTEELSELELRIAELRSELKLPPLVEAQEIRKEASPVTEEDAEEEEEEEEVFNPFEAVEVPSAVQETIPERPPVRTVPVPTPPSRPVPTIEPINKVFTGQPINTGNTPDTAYQVTPSDDLIEEPKRSQNPIAPPVIDPRLNQSVNPRFVRPKV